MRSWRPRAESRSRTACQQSKPSCGIDAAPNLIALDDLAKKATEYEKTGIDLTVPLNLESNLAWPRALAATGFAAFAAAEHIRDGLRQGSTDQREFHSTLCELRSAMYTANRAATLHGHLSVLYLRDCDEDEGYRYCELFPDRLVWYVAGLGYGIESVCEMLESELDNESCSARLWDRLIDGAWIYRMRADWERLSDDEDEDVEGSQDA